MLCRPRELEIQEIETPSPGPGEVLIAVEAVGICGTDVLVYSGNYPATYPIVPGHEYAGTVVDIGPGVTGINKGDRVVSEASWPCERCPNCLSGRPEHCLKRNALGRSLNGAFAEYIKVPAKVIHTISPEISPEEGQSLVTLACAVRAVRRSELRFGEEVAQVGTGHAGLLILQLLHLAGASRIVVFDLLENRLTLASQLGASETINVSREGWQEKLQQISSDRGFDLVIDAAGSGATFRQALWLARSGGRMLAFSIYGQVIDGFQAQDLYHKELTIIGTKAGTGGYELAVRLMERQLVKVNPLITHRLPLERLAEGFELIENKRTDALRVVIHLK